MEEEKFALLPLPASVYELATWKKATVQYDYHISVDKMYYSVPYEYIKHQIDVRVTRTIIEVFFKSFRIASHMRLHGKEGQFSTLPEHMPAHHKMYVDFNRDYFLEWAEGVGLHTLMMMKGILASYKVEKQALKSCLALTKLADQYSVERLESSCERALEYSPRPNVNSVKTILKTGQDKLQTAASNPAAKSETQVNTHSFIRGAAYYGRKEK
ncbi:Mu transposase domain-containing protein [Peribacillus cavernae]|uniref:Mu transposase domain-containing protein n=1 Tax=Peribacillus cavernae TaxID=1674310 RepID=UPI001C8D5135|nr:hypothetical protein [Peribacillus cavernae]MDQ0220692.1 hypothetical protein [Peribacillus cavernae]